MDPEVRVLSGSLVDVSLFQIHCRVLNLQRFRLSRLHSAYLMARESDKSVGNFRMGSTDTDLENLEHLNTTISYLDNILQQ
jgi:hypothetical protein